MKKTFYILMACLVLLGGCKEKGERFEINGQISSADKKTLYFEAVTLNGVEALDSVKLGKDGTFRFYGKRPANPEFYRLRVERQIINLAVDSTETLTVKAELPVMATQYEVEGSSDCLVIRELSRKQIALQAAIRGIAENRTLMAGEQDRLIGEAVEAYKEDVKRNYILKDPSSSYAYFALFQAVGGSLVFNPVNNPEDVRFVAAVATAWNERYPGTTRTENLCNIALQGLKNTKRPAPVDLGQLDSSKISTAGFIDVELPDIKGTVRRLSDIHNKVILLDFTAYSLPDSKERILYLRSLYDKYAGMGFEIYQVAIDPDEHYWKTACEYLPWICVYDAAGESSSNLQYYQVARLSTGFLINKAGDLVSRVERTADLERMVKELCEN